MSLKDARKTHCPKGHAYDDANTYVSPQGHRLCRACHREAQRVRRAAKNPEYLEYLRTYRGDAKNKRKRWERDLFRRYGLTVEEYEVLLTVQEGRCAGCRRDPPEGLLLPVDHDHLTGMVRGLLCNTCNRALGLLKDDIEVLVRLVAYLDPSLEKLLDVLREGGIPGVRIDALREAG